MWQISRFVFCCATLLGVISTLAHGATAKLVIGYSTINPRIAPLWIAEKEGYFKKYGLNPELIYVRSTSLLVTSLKTGQIPVAYGGGGGILGASVEGTDLKILATFTGKMTNDLVARPGIKTAKELRGKFLGVQSIGGTNWIGAMLWLEHLGLDPTRDKITIQMIGNQTVRAQALSAGKIDAAAVDTVFSNKLAQQGFTVLGDSHQVDIPFVGVDVVTTQEYLAEQPGVLENLLKALLESLAYIQTPSNEPQVIDLIMKQLRISDRGAAREGYQELLQNMNRKPYPSVEGLRNVQRITKILNPHVAKVNLNELVNPRFIRKLDDDGFIDRLFSTGGDR
jgi:ABC-type nitrate/sulfonate/bicarbonate transport system substrate-binding protein